MTTEFQIDDAKIVQIVDAFGITQESVHSLHKAYTAFSPYLKEQHLAHGAYSGDT
jgi:hypothetical protein